MPELAVRERPAAERTAGITNLRRHTARGMLVNSVYQLTLVGIGVVKGIVVAALLTRSDYGLLGVLGLTLWTGLSLKNQFGAGNKYVQQSDENQEHAFQQAFTVELIFTAAAVPVSAASVIAFALLSGTTAVLAPGLALLALLPSIALQFPVQAFYRRMDYRRQRTLQAIDPVGGAVITIVLAALGAGYWSFVIGLIAGSWAGAIVALRACPYRLALRLERGTLRSYVQFSVPLLIAAVAGLALFQVLYLVGSVPLGLAGLGAFTLVGNIVQFTDQADAIVTDTLYPAVCAVRDRVELLSEVFVKSNRLSLMWAVPFGVGMTLFAADLVRFVLGARWEPAVPLLEIMGLVTAIHHVGYNWPAFFMARGRTWAIALGAVIPAAVVAGAGVPLMFSAGLVGVGYAFALGEAAGFVSRAILLARFFHGFRLFRHLVRAFVPTALAAIPVLCLRAASGPEDSLARAAAVLGLYVTLTVSATLVLERPLLRESTGYLLRDRTQPA